MRRVALIYNPASGQQSSRHQRAIEQALEVLHKAGVEAEALATTGPGSAGAQALEAARQGCDTILACGGDGTVHEVLQSLVGTQIALGVVPLGTANALAADLGLQTSPKRAVERLLTATPMRVPVGLIHYRDVAGMRSSRYFTVVAGVGADALFMSGLDARMKRRFGYALYLIEGVRVWATHSFPLFHAVIEERGKKKPRVEEISQLLAVRIRDFGGALHNIAPGATLRKDALRLVAFKTRSRMDFLRFLLAVMCGRQTFSRRIELLNAVSVECRESADARAPVFVEADGELLGSLPVKIEIAEQTLSLLIPHHARP